MENEEEKGSGKKKGEKAFQEICITDNKEISPSANEAHTRALCKEADNKADKKAQKRGVGDRRYKTPCIFALLFSSNVARYMPTTKNPIENIAPVSP